MYNQSPKPVLLFQFALFYSHFLSLSSRKRKDNWITHLHVYGTGQMKFLFQVNFDLTWVDSPNPNSWIIY